MNRDILESVNLDAQPRCSFGQSFFNGTPEGIRVAVVKNRRGSGFGDEFFQLLDGITLADDEPRSDRAKIAIQSGKRTAKERLAI